MAEKNLSIKLSLNDKQFQSNLKKATKSMAKFGNNMKSLGRTISTGVTLPIVALGVASVKAFDDQIKAETLLRTSLKGNAEAYKNLTEQARELQKVTIFGDEATIQAQSYLAQLGLTEEAILRLTPLIQDFATAQGIQLTDAAKLVAKSVGSSTNALSRYGIAIEGEVGSTERLESAVNALSTAFGGQAEAIAKEGLAPLQQLQNQLGDVAEQFGELIIQFIQPLTEILQTLADYLSNLTEEQKKNILEWGLLLAALGPVIIAIGSLVTTLATLIPIAASVVAAITPITAAIVAGTLALGYFIKRFKDLNDEWEEWHTITGDFEPITDYVAPPPSSTPTGGTFERTSVPQRIEPIKVLNVELKKTKELFETMTPIVEQFDEQLSGMDIVANSITQSFQTFGNTIQGVFAQALQSQDGFFKAFLEGSKQALASLLAQITAMIILNALLGGTGIGALMGFQNIGGIAGIGQVLGGVGNVNANSVGAGGGLKSMINTGGSTEVYGVISGADILLSSDRARNNRNRTRGY